MASAHRAAVWRWATTRRVTASISRTRAALAAQAANRRRSVMFEHKEVHAENQSAAFGDNASNNVVNIGFTFEEYEAALKGRGQEVADSLTRVFGAERARLEQELRELQAKLADSATAYAAYINEQRRYPFYVPDLPRSAFVGRENDVKELVDALIAHQDRALIYLPGVGKTNLALAIAHHPDLRDHFDGILWADVGKETDLEPVLDNWARALRIPDEVTSKLPTLKHWQREVRDAIGERHMLIILDDVWDEEAGQDFMGLARHCTYLVTTRDQNVAADLAQEARIIEPLTEPETIEFLRQLAPQALEFIYTRDDLTKTFRQVVTNLGGLPLAVRLVGHYLNREFRKNNPERFIRALNAIEDEGALFGKNPKVQDITEGLTSILDIQYESIDDEILRRGLLGLSVFRPNPHTFTAEMAEQVCGIGRDHLDLLSDIGLVSTAPEDCYSLHRVLSDYAYKKLSVQERADLHIRAMAFYQTKIDAIAGTETLSYASWYRYENPEWQQLQQARLYHLGHAQGHWAVAQAILRIYFDAFWWWGYYQPFAYCDALIKDWLQRTEAPEITLLLQSLADFRAHYPEGYEKHDKPGWSRVKQALLTLREVAALDGDAAALSAGLQHVRGLMDFFLAESYAYGEEGDAEQALKTYRASRDTFAALGDDWNDAWISFYLADHLYSSCDDSATALEDCQRAIRLSENMPLAERDPEVLGNVYRLLGDMAFDRDEYAQAAQHYGRAGFYAYAFQGIPHPPDEYTAHFYQEITEKVGARVAQLMHDAPDNGQRMLNTLRADWQPYWDRVAKAGGAAAASALPNTAEEIIAILFPQAPSAEEVKSGSAAYQAQVLEVVAALKL
ncbi:MAG: hypothetical protein EPO06_08260 [Burkholderiaceae bacterium]|nr:MAG: hypothetical protein EPO06_08260 [Burkholderiaceae bacterium]